jgi:predicted DNA-binding ribbon-helix-helix protein
MFNWWKVLNMKKISVSLSGHQTSISLEPEFIDALRNIAKKTNKSVASIIANIDANRKPNTNLSSAIRIWVLKYFIK